MDCLICTAKTDAFACKDCAETARSHLVSMAELLEPNALDQRRAGVRAISYSGVGGRSGGEKPLPFNPRVAEAENLAHGTLFEVARQLVEDESSLYESLPRASSTAVLAAWLSRQVMEHLRFMPDCDDYFSDIADKHRAVVRLWDNPPDEMFIGSCGALIEVEGGVDVTCTEAVYAERGRASVKCRRCRSEHDVAARYGELLARCTDHLATLKEIAALLAPIHGERVRLRKLNYYVDRGRLKAKGDRPEWMSNGSIRSVSVYRIGDISAIVAADIKAEEEAATKRAEKRRKARTAA